MGKGHIISHIGAGLYNITVNLDKDGLTARIADVDRLILQLDSTDIPAAALRYNQARIRYDEAEVNVNTAIAAFLAGTLTKAQLVNYVDRKNELYGAYTVKRRDYDTLTLQRAALVKEKEYLTSKIVADPAVTAWCADLTTDLTGTVGTIEIPNERKHVPIIRPGYDSGAVYDATRDGQSSLIAGMTPAAAVHAYTLLPGWQKWKPTYRVGVITAIAGDTCDVLLDAAYSSAYLLDVNNTRNLTGIDIVYMTCNGAPFVEGDRVVVEFQAQDYRRPRVIGFESNPRACWLNLHSLWGGGEKYEHAGITGTIINTCVPGGYTTDIMYGITWWPAGGYIIWDVQRAEFLRIQNDCSLITAINIPPEWIIPPPGINKYPEGGLTVDGSNNLIACTLEETFPGSGIGAPFVYKFDGLSNNVIDTIILGDWLFPQDICFDHNFNLIVSVYDVIAGICKIIKYAGFSTGVLDTIVWPLAPGSASAGVAWCRGNLITADGILWGPPIIPQIVQHNGFSTDVLSQTDATTATWLTYPEVPTAG